MYLFFDTETNGKPISYKASVNDVNNWPRVTQLAFALFADNGECVETYCQLIKPDGWTIPKEQFFIDNNMSTERCETEGIPIIYALKEFDKSLACSKYLIAHNMEFDSKVMGAEFIRLGAMSQHRTIKLCTMQSTTDLLKLPGPYGYKFPRLEELHRWLFGHDFTGAHDALNDVMATAKCFFELKRRNLIRL